ncbi:Metastasis-associated protein mta3 [Saguinus oedipus]|uniref:Metastasis-associated protein mta3 n=1 Tax=Saguinus oedipus TaxID=9490 RepID=A0ABQ9U7V9_SAGOE|nr:Metastasis-associated protein mta3 [Saguinus oedipus]
MYQVGDYVYFENSSSNPYLIRRIEELNKTASGNVEAKVGKCSVALLNETESVLTYLDKEDTFFYSLVYDPSLKTLLVDKGEIRVGPRYQADFPEMLLEGETDEREQSKLEVKVWDPNSPLTDRQIDQFLVVARAVGTFARALDCSSSVRQPSLHMSAVAAP